MNRCTGPCDMTEIPLKTALETIQSVNQYTQYSNAYKTRNVFQKDKQHNLEIRLLFKGTNQCHQGPISCSSASKLCRHIICKQTRQQGPAEYTWTYFLPITNYLQLILNQYQEVGQKPAHTPTLKNLL